MIYDGIVIKVEKKPKDQLYLFFLDPESNNLSDGINISDHKVYDNIRYDQIMVVHISLKDGTLELDKIDLEEFIHGDKYGREDIFLYIQDILLYNIDSEINLFKNKIDITAEQIVKKGEMNDLALELIEKSKEDIKNLKRK
jgi:hypothetical protein